MKSKLALCAALTLVTTSAFAHVTANPDNGRAGAYFQTSFRISHGCDGSDTTVIHLKIPPGFISLHPQTKPGWTVRIVKRTLDKPVDAGHGKTVNEEFAEIIWSGGNLPDAQYDEFGIVAKLPDKKQTLWFPVTQICVRGKNEWTQIPSKNEKWHDLEHPAPFVKVDDDAMADMPGMSH